MNAFKVILILFLCLITTEKCLAQNTTCVYCNMEISNVSFRAKAISGSEKANFFDAIECLVNYLKTKNESSFKKLLVTDYSSGKFIDAGTAFYIKSKAIPSPMGANLSAYLSEIAAKRALKSNTGQIFSWDELKEQFIGSDFGSTDHSHHHHGGAKAYAPVGIMGDHLHPKGGLMVTFRSMYMFMKGNLDGNEKISDTGIYENFMVAPQEMSMQMYMVGAMYAPTEQLTLTMMQGFSNKNMDLTARMMMPDGMAMLRDFSTSSTGLADLKLGLLCGLINSDKASVHLNTGLSLPIGDISNRDTTPMMDNAKLPYAMQLGSGTFDFNIGATIKGANDNFSWGIQQLNILRTGSNSESYRFGNLNQLDSWLAYGFSKVVSTSVRLSGSRMGSINGTDRELNPMMVTASNTRSYGSEIINGAVGSNLLLANNQLVLGIDIMIPLYQNYNGIFMDEDLAVNFAVKYLVL